MPDMAWQAARVLCVNTVVYLAVSASFYDLAGRSEGKDNSGYGFTVPLTKGGANREFLASRQRMQGQHKNRFSVIRGGLDLRDGDIS
jgi:hypothetical protein